jgi:energy-converting hydrogenase Eha subunit A
VRGPKLIAVLAVGVIIVVICSVILAVYAGAPPVDPEDPTPVPTPKAAAMRQAAPSPLISLHWEDS